MNKIKCAVIGVGYLGKFHAEKYTNLANAELVAVCDVDKKACQEIANKYQVPAYSDYKKLVAEVKPDAVSIVVPTSLHYQTAKFCLEHNIHVLLEKPITTTVEEADKLINLAKNNKLTLQIGHLERFNSAYSHLLQFIKDPLLLECTRLAPYKARCTDVSVILDLMIHDIDIIYSIIQSPIKSIVANGYPLPSKSLDLANARIEFENGAMATLTASRINPFPARRLNVLQNNKYLCSDLNEKTITIMQNDSDAFKSEKLELAKNDALLDEITSFVDCIINGSPPLVSGESGKKALTTALEIERIALKNLHKKTME
jgi:predicted dehydrogenase